jgi:glutathione-specific gamma-glutamylcyclotransferase
MPKTMSLTPELVALTVRPEPDLGPEPGFSELTEDELLDLARRFFAEAAGKPVWVFAYGSLIWKPDFEAVENRRATAFGWHRSFCIKMTGWRGTPQTPGLMMALERGGRCDGVIYRLPDEGLEAQLRRVLYREVRFREIADMVRWVPVRVGGETLRAMTFWAGPRGEHIASKLPLPDVAKVLARACGPAGSCAEYLYNTVSHLEALGIHDRNLWRLQELVADEIRQAHGLLQG